MPKNVIKILLVEDNPADVVLLREFLAEDPLSDFQVTVAERLRQGLSELGRETFDILLLDLGLPDSQGLATFQSAHEKFPQIPIIVLSGMTDELFALQAVQAGAQDYLVKSEAGWKLGSRAIRYAIERHQAQTAMRASETRFSTIFHSSPIPVAITRIRDNRILEINEAWSQITGYRRKEAIGKILTEFNIWVHPEERGKMIEMLRRDGRVSGFEFQMRRSDGEVADLLFSAELIELGGEPCMLSMAQDITGRKIMEENLRESEENFRQITETIQEVFYVYNPSTDRFLYVSPNYEKLWLEPIQKVYDDPRSFTEAVIPEDRERFSEAIRREREGGEYFNLEYRIRRLDGTVRHVHSRNYPILGKSGEELRVVGIAEDITERKKMEENLRESEESARLAYSAAELGTWKQDASTGIFQFDERARRHFDVDEARPSRETVTSRVHPEDIPRIREKMAEIVHAPDARMFLEYRVIHRDGSTHWLAVHAHAHFEENKGEQKAVFITGTSQDVTESKRAEEALRQSEERFRSLYENATVGIYRTTAEGEILLANPALVNMLGYESFEELAKRNLGTEGYATGHERRTFQKKIEEAGVVRGVESAWTRKDGTAVFVRESAKPIRDEKGRLLYYEGTVEDVTERRQAEERIAQTEKRYKALIENAPDGVVLIGLDGKFKYASPAALKMFNYKEENIAGENPNEQTHPEDLPMVLGVLREIVENPSKVPTIQYRYKHQNGDWRWIESTFTNLLAEPSVEAIVINFHDITERRKAEVALRESEVRYRTLLESTSDSVYVLDREWRHVVVNEAATRFVRMPKERLLGNKLTDLFPGIEETVFFKTFQRVMETRIPDSIIGEYTYPDGQNGWYEVHVDPTPEGILCISHDITERRRAEEALQKSLHSLEEAERISRVGHYEIDVQSGKATWSQEVFRIFGIDPAEGEPTVEEYAQFIHPQDSNAVYEMYTRSATQGTPFDLVYRILRGDGQTCYVHSQAETARNEQGQITKLFGTFQDITERKQAEEKLQNAHEFLQGVQDSLSAHIATLDHEGNIVQVNAAWRGFGYYNGLVHPNHCIGDNYLEVCDSAKGPDAEEAALAANALRKVIGGEESETSFEYACHSPREKRWFIVRITSFENGGRKWLVVSHENITPRKQTEEALRQRINEMELLYENSLAFTQSFDPKEIAEKIIELFGEKLNWHHTAIRLVNPQDDSLELAAFDEPELEGENTQTRLSRVVTRIGEGLSGWALQQSKPLRLGEVSRDPHYVESYPGIHSGLYVPLKSGERALGVISIESEIPNAFSEADEQFIVTLANQAAIALENARLYREISLHAEELEQRVQERTAEIETTRQRLELALKTAGLGIWEWDLESGEEVWDDRTFALHGISREKAHATLNTWRKSVHPDDLPLLRKQMEQTLRKNKPYNPEYRVVLADGGIRHIKTTAVVIHGAEGKPARVLGADQDITLHKQAEETLLKANAEMERSLRMKTEFLATMSHELRTPLNSILGISDSLEEQISGALNEKQLKYVRVINESGRHLLELINDILDLSKIEAGKLDLIIEPVEVEKICAASLRLIKELAQKKSLRISFEMDKKAKYVSGDARRLKQILVNLLSNAVKFTPAGREIGLAVKASEETREIRFTVWDQGIGISEEDRNQLFQPFVQLKSGLAREYAGSGLGLALVAQMARLHKGHIDLESRLNVGSRFTVTLPWTPPNTGQLRAEDSTPGAGNTVPDITGGTKILIVEDTEVVAQLISEYLRHKGYRTRIALNGVEGVEMAKRERPQIILMDVMMPEMNGMDATKKLRADPKMKDVVIIGLTALAMPSDREECIAAGMNDHLSKPVQMQELIKIIEHYLK